MRPTRLAFSCLLALATGQSFADTALIPAEDFARQADYRSAEISPNGQYVSVIAPFEKYDAVHIIKLDGNYSRNVLKFDPKEKESIADTVWTDDERIIAFKAWYYVNLKRPIYTGAIFASNADGSDLKQLFGYREDTGNIRSPLKDRATTIFNNLLPGSDGQAIFSYYPWQQGSSDTKSSLYRVDTHTGKRSQIESFDSGEAFTDRNGVARFRLDSTLDDEPVNWYRPRGQGDAWVRVPANIAGRDITPLDFEADNNHVFALISDKGEPAALYRVDLAAGTRERLAGHEQMEISDVLWGGYDGKPFAVRYDSGRPKIDYVDPKSEWAQLHAALMKLFPGQLVSFTSFSQDDQKILFYVWSDRHPGAYYLFDRKTKQPSQLFESMERIDSAKMAPTLPFEFKNSRGDTLYGFYTAPLGKQGPQPMVVIPHGGPFGPYDRWGYDPDVQFLANRGYAVLQVNFRGSGGRGENFERSTYREWGTGIQDDIADGVKWTIAQGLADAKRICIYGASFGGYSAMMNPIRYPELYRCAIGYAGVYDLAEMHDSGDIDDSKQGRSYLSRAVGSDPELFAAQSPAMQAEKLNLPILLIHGKNDRRAPIAQYNRMEAALKKAGKPFESMLRSDEGHGFYDTTNRTEFYERLEAFLRKHNPVN